MKHQCFSVKDKAVNAFLPPFLVRSNGEALRSFTAACNDENHQFYKHAGDYSLYYVGEWCDESGMYLACDPVRVISAAECHIGDPFRPELRNGGNGAVAGRST